MNQTNIKVALAVALFVAWVLLIVFQVPGADDLIAFIKISLTGLGAHTLTMVNTSKPDAGTTIITTKAQP